MTGKLAIHGGTPARTRPNPPMFPGGTAMGRQEEEALGAGARACWPGCGPSRAGSRKVSATSSSPHDGTRRNPAVSKCLSNVNASRIPISAMTAKLTAST